MTDHMAQTTANGMIISLTGGLYSVILDDDSVIQVKAKGEFRHIGVSPMVGDHVMVQLPTETEGGCILSIAPRKNSLIRPPMANLDYLLITFSVTKPEPVLQTIDSLIAIAEHNQITPVIIITKCELDEVQAQNLYQIYRRAGFHVFLLSHLAKTGLDTLIRFIKDNLPGKTCAVAGASGVGKSTLLQALNPNVPIAVGTISKNQRGKQTTRQVSFYPKSFSPNTPCTFIADTPGFSLLDFVRFDFFNLDDLPLTFREFQPFLGKCRYTDCSHTKESDCPIVQAVKDGTISQSRHSSYLAIYTSLKLKKDHCFGKIPKNGKPVQ